MRVKLRAVCTCLAFAAAASCTDANRVVVHMGKIDDRTAPDVGDDYDFERMPSEGYTQQKPGYFVVHSDQDWLFVWKDPRPDAKPPPPPQNVDYKKRMIFVATAADDDAKSLEVQKVMSLYSGLHIYVLETLAGASCPAQAAKARPMDIVQLDTVSYDVHVHVDRVHDDTCGPPPQSVVECRVAGSSSPGADKLAASPGNTIDCDGSKSKPSVGGIIDRNWQLLASPPGSRAKLTVGKDSAGATLPVDAWGMYSVGLSIHDNAREGSAAAEINAAAPEGGIELFWSHVPRDFDVATLPRTELHVVELPYSVGAGSFDCSAQASKPWCEVKAVAMLQQAELRAEPSKRYRVSVKHLDERKSGGPIPCVRTFPRGAPAVSTCDSDDGRKANAVWDLGALDPATGDFYDPRKPKPPPPPAPSASANTDAGAPPPLPTHTAAPPPAHTTAPPPPAPTSTGGGTDLEL